MDCNLIVFHLILGKRFRIWPILVLDVKDSSNEKKKALNHFLFWIMWYLYPIKGIILHNISFIGLEYNYDLFFRDNYDPFKLEVVWFSSMQWVNIADFKILGALFSKLNSMIIKGRGFYTIWINPSILLVLIFCRQSL